MQALNYCRQFKGGSSSAETAVYQKMCRDISSANKFIVDVSTVADMDFVSNAINMFDLNSRIELPFDSIVIESGHAEVKNIFHYSLPDCWEVDQWGEHIAYRHAACYPRIDDIWLIGPKFLIPRSLEGITKDADGELLVDPQGVQYDASGCSLIVEKCDNTYMADMANSGISFLLFFLGLLQCSNVMTEKLPARPVARKAKGCLPFDSYYVLTIDNSADNPGTSGVHRTGRSPREHVRRGHVRRLADGRKIWINSTVVARGSAGCIVKDYAL